MPQIDCIFDFIEQIKIRKIDYQLFFLSLIHLLHNFCLSLMPFKNRSAFVYL